MITIPVSARIWIAAGVTDLRRGFDGLSAMVQMKLEQDDPFGGHVFVFRGRPLPDHWPRETQTYKPEQTACPDCGDTLGKLGKDISELLNFSSLCRHGSR